eukprot:3773464-Alexandrium_andersonii.AAC.1
MINDSGQHVGRQPAGTNAQRMFDVRVCGKTQSTSRCIGASHARASHRQLLEQGTVIAHAF